MKLLLTLGAAILGISAAAATAAPCGPGHRRQCPVDPIVDLTGVPDISKKIVAGEPAPPPLKPAFDPNPVRPYTGPTLGIAPLPRAPTVGYKWIID